ncbi:MAG: AAA family ATPase, partial [Bacteroidota bacterium]
RTVRREREDALQGTGRIETRLAEVHVRLEDLTDRTRNELDCELPSDEIEIPEGFDAQTARQELDTLRRKIRDLGAVNELALEEYEEEKQRLDFLTEQRDDLLGAETTLLDTITEINETASERFRETFEEIQGHFSRLFTLLFGEGASAKVELAGEKDPLESPIEIFARPRGKRNVTIAQLSGGEKTLTATALLFAIYLVKPSPFCILDEVDAPLDDANIGRFMHLIREFSKDTQFILVTHNKLTMEAADRMYGVTMQEAGVSSVVSVSFENSASAA